MSRLFYDPSAPVMLSEDQAATQQIDQILVSKLQSIDHNFAQSTQILTDAILQKVQKHGENSQAIYESIKFWRPFFEAAARTRLSDPYATEQSMTTEAPTEAVPQEADRSLEFDQPSVGQVSPGNLTNDATPRSTAAPLSSLESPLAAANGSSDWPSAPDISPLQSLESDFRRIAASPADYPDVDVGLVRQGINQLHAASPNITMPSIDLGRDGGVPSPSPAGSSAASSSFLPPRSPGGARLKAGADKLPPALLQRVLAKQQQAATSRGSPAPQRPGASTPARGKAVFPADVPKNWNGLADLSHTKLDAFDASPIKRAEPNADDSAWEGDFAANGSPLPAKAFAKLNLSPVKFKATPGKDAAARVSRYAYDALDEDEDIAPPSVLRDVKKHSYDLSVTDPPSIAPSPSEGARKGFEEEAYEDDDEDEEEEDLRAPNALGDLAGGGATAKIDDLLDGGDDFAQLVDDDEGIRGDLIDDDEETGGLPEEEEDYLVEEGISQDVAPTGPEDTLFGMPQRKARFAEEADDSFDDDSFAAGQGKTGGQLRMLGGEDMHTLHGGDLLDSEPFEGSPLASRDRA